MAHYVTLRILEILQIPEFAGRIESVTSNFRPDYPKGQFRMARMYSSE